MGQNGVMESIGQRIKRLRKELGITQAVLARMTGLAQGTISDLEVGRSKGTGEIVAIATALKTTPAYLTSGKHGAQPASHIDTPSGAVLLIPRLNVMASAGSGSHGEGHEVVVDNLPLPRWWVSMNMPNLSAATNLAIITGFGDSMDPTFKDGDPLFVDTGISTFDVDGVYVFTRAGEVFVKRIQRQFDGSIRVISDNRAAYEPITVTPSELSEIQVRGRVRFAWNGRRL